MSGDRRLAWVHVLRSFLFFLVVALAEAAVIAYYRIRWPNTLTYHGQDEALSPNPRYL